MSPRMRSLALVCTTLGALVGIAAGCGGKDSPTAPPDPTIVATVSVAPSPQALVSIGETRQLTATARNAAGAPVPGAVISWSSAQTNILTVSGTGLATSVANGSATVTATADGVQGSITLQVQQQGAALELVGGDTQGATVATALDTALTLVVKDANGHPVPAALIDFAVTAGGGSVDPAQATAGTDGIVSAAWTLGTQSGPQELVADLANGAATSLTFTALAFAAEPDSIALFDGGEQSEVASLPLPAPVRVSVRDQYGNPVPDVPVVFTLAADGALDSTDVLTNLEGIAATTWTLGAALGEQSVSAVIPDSAIAEGVVVSGGPVTITAQAVAFAVLDVAGTAVAGDATTLTGSGFAIDPAQNVVTVDGVPATITGGTQSSLTVTMPSWGCVPGRERNIVVTRGALMSAMDRRVDPEGLVALAPGGRVILPEENDGCIQLPSAAGGDDEYLVGVTSTRALNAELLFRLASDDGTAPPEPELRAVRSSASSRAGTVRRATTPTIANFAAVMASPSASPAARHLARREWESARFSRPRAPTAAARSASLRAVGATASAVGDITPVRVPDLLTDACNAYTEVQARVIAIGPRVTVATDATLPTGPVNTAAIALAIDTFLDQFGDVIFAAASQYFGLPSDIDGDERVTVVLTPAVIPMGVMAFSSAVDAVDRATCPASNEGEVIYIALPAAPDVPTLTARFIEAAPQLAHELIHVVQARRLAAGGVPMATWLAEGQAELGAEIIGFLTAGIAARADLGAAALGGAAPTTWLAPRFQRLSSLFGWDGAAGSIPGAPERCSLFGFGGLSIPCRDDYASGAAWSFMRYVADRMAAGAGNEAGFLQGLIDTDLLTDGTALLQALTGSTLDDLMIEWAMTLYVDGRVSPAAAPRLQFPSWDLVDVFDALPPERRLDPPSHGFSLFDEARSVVGGGTAYTRVMAGGAHGPLAIRARDAAGGALGSEMRPRLWVVRVR